MIKITNETTSTLGVSKVKSECDESLSDILTQVDNAIKAAGYCPKGILIY